MTTRPRRQSARSQAVPDAQEQILNSVATDWHDRFLAVLAETSCVRKAAAAAAIEPSLAYLTRRRDERFATSWRAAIHEGYEHLELETLQRLRMGLGKDEPKFDIANALRLIGLHRSAMAERHSARDVRDEDTVLASIDAKLERHRARHENVARILEDEGISVPRLPCANG